MRLKSFLASLIQPQTPKLILLLIVFCQVIVSVQAMPNKTINECQDDNSKQRLEQYSKRTKVISGGHRNRNCVLIQIDNHPYYINIPDGPGAAGLYIVAVYKEKVLQKSGLYLSNLYWTDGLDNTTTSLPIPK